MLKKAMNAFFVLGSLPLQMVITNHQVSAMDEWDYPSSSFVYVENLRDCENLKQLRGKQTEEFSNNEQAAKEFDKVGQRIARRYAEASADYAKGLMLYSERAEYSEAFEFFKRAASVNHPRAMFYVGLYHEFGLGVVERSFDEAAQWYTKALLGPEVCEEALPGLKRVIQKKEERIW